MKPYEKAVDIYNKFRNTSPALEANYKSKKRALIAVDEILNFIEEADPQALSYEMFGYRDYWREVKEHLKNM